MASELQPLLSRDRYTDEEWEYATSGRCGWYVADYPAHMWCEQPSSPESYYRFCGEHDGEAREHPTYGR